MCQFDCFIMGQELCKGNEDRFEPQLPMPTVTVLPERKEPRPTSVIVAKDTRDPHQPDESFATKTNNLPKYTEALLQRLDQLGDFNYPGAAEYSAGKMMNSAYLLHNGAVYAGEWKLGKIHGRGQYYLPDGSLLECSNVENEVRGRGRIIYSNGDYYEGEIASNMANGIGKYVEADVVYEGEMKDNQPHGRGVEKGKDFLFEGMFQSGERKKGKLIWGDDDDRHEYEGPFHDNLFSGQGVLTTEKGQYVGTFKQGLKSGNGKYTWKNGRYYLGQFKNGVKQGEGSLFDQSGVLLSCGIWVNDREQV